MTFSGAVLLSDINFGGANGIYSWGTGAATAIDNNGNGLAGGLSGLGLYLDIGITQTYQTVPGSWSFSEINVGTCNAAAINNSAAGPPGPGTPATGSVVEGVVNGAGLPLLVAGCGNPAVPWTLGAGPFGAVGIGTATNLTSYGQFYFNPGGVAGNQIVTLPWGDDFPDPSYDSGLFPTLSQLQADTSLTNDSIPEPATGGLIAGGLGILALLTRRRRA